ncbi:unnamed protein product [Mycena citricolor]|uniref:Structural maintenance of chromosomes protein n=1 Tax=Mycena citricolor TaxID=2018698 RepID=A0AAD2K8A3_9AGAR|nr:unnamed protein product [Mycena citricolor]
MPPRRSSRSARASVEPSEAPTSKRKRQDPTEKENKLRAKQSRSKPKDLEDIPESDVDENEEEDGHPPVKRPRPSLERESDDENESPVPKRRNAKASHNTEESRTRRGKRAPAKTLAISSDEEEEADSEVETKPKPKPKRTAANKSRPIVADSDEDDVGAPASGSEEEEDEKPKKSNGRRASTTKAKSKSKSAPKSKKRASVTPAPSHSDAELASSTARPPNAPGPDAYEVVPNSELVVTRTATKSNSSRYTINRRTSTFTEVQTLLKGRGIDLDHKRFLILQGEVESIAQMKPKGSTEHEDGLLEYLEDIIGTSHYVEPISESLTQIEVFQEERGSKLNRLRIVEKEKNSLEEQKKEAENYLRLKNDKALAQNKLWQWALWKSFIAEEESQRSVAQFTEELKAEQDRNKDDRQHFEALQKHHAERQAAYKKVQETASAAIQELAGYEKQQIQLKEKLKHSTAKDKKASKSLAEDKAAHATAERTIAESTNKMKKKRIEMEEQEASLAQEEAKLEAIQDSLKGELTASTEKRFLNAFVLDKTQVFHDQIEAKQKDLQPWTTKINAKTAAINVATSERDALSRKARDLVEALESADNDLQQLKRDQDEKHEQQETLKADKKAHQAAIANQDAQKSAQELRSQASSARHKLNEARSTVAEKTSQNRVVDGLNQYKSSGRIPGFHGRLGSLGTIPDKYDIAVSTACGALHNMVVDHVEEAQSAIQYLRQHNLGRATFIVLDKCNQGGMDPIQTPEGVPRLFDLITPKEPRFAKAFYKALANTLVVDNQDQANRIAFGGRQRWRVVTLAGQLIESTGVMSGGGNSPARGAMSSKLAPDAISPEALQRLDQECAQVEQRLERATREARDAEAALDHVKQQLPETETAFQKLGLDIEIGKNRITEASKRLSELKSQNKPNSADLTRASKLDSEIERTQADLNDLQGKASGIEQAIAELEERIIQIGGSKLLAQKSKVDGIKLLINLANEEITKAEVAKAKAEKDVVKLAQTIESNSKIKTEVDAELEELDRQVDQLTDYINTQQKNVDEAKSAAENCKDDLDSVKQSLEEKEEEIQSFRQREVAIETKLDEAQRLLDENAAKVEHWRENLETLVLEEIEDDDDEDEEGNEFNDKENAHNAAKVKSTNQEPATADEDVKMEDDGLKLDDEGPSEEGATNGLPNYRVEELAKFKQREMNIAVETLDDQLKRMKPNLEVLEEYKKVEQLYLARAQDVEETTKLRDAEKAKYEGLRKRRLDEFMTGFSLISLKLKEMYQMITLGGNAELELVDSMDPFSEGIIFSVMPPKKSWKNISNLSGGEKARVLSFVFEAASADGFTDSEFSCLGLCSARLQGAFVSVDGHPNLMAYGQPTPLYFMDEIDAALDFRNVSIVANYIKDRTKNAQFIIISLRNDMFELSHRLIGIYKTANATRSISIDNHSLNSSIVKAV